MLDYNNRVVLITGAGAGIGAEAARQFAKAGAILMLADKNDDNLQNVIAELKEQGSNCEGLAGDVSNEQDVQRLVNKTLEHFGKLDVAVNNAGVDLSHERLADIETEHFDAMMAVNVRGVFLCMKYQIPAMISSQGGAIVNVSSVAGVIGAPNMSAYAATKHAVIGLTKSAAHEYGRQNIRVNAVCPYITQTDMFEKILNKAPDRDRMIKDVSRPSALKRIAQPAEVAQAMLWACDVNNSYMTGHELMIDGGLTAV